MLKRVFLALCVLLAPSMVWAQSALPGLAGAGHGGSTLCQYLTVAPTLVNGQPSFLQCDNAGNLKSVLTQGGSVLSTGNPIFAQLTTSSAAVGTVNPTTAANWAIGATAGTLPANALLMGCSGVNAQQSAVTNGQLTNPVCGLDGTMIVKPYTVKELASRGSGSSSATGTTITVLAASGTSSVYEYLTSLQCSNTSATTLYVTLNDTASSVFIVPSGGGTNVTFPVPLRSNSANSALTATLSSSNGPVFCNGQGYNSL